MAVAEELHFRRAAERLYVAQPAVSEQIRKLEAELGVQLFERTPRRVTLTDAGAALLEEAGRLLRQAEVARQAAQNADGRVRSRISLGFPPDALPAVVPRALRRLTASAPGIEVALETGPAAKLIDAVQTRRIEAMIAALPARLDQLRSMSLGHEHLVAAIPVTDDRALETSLPLERVAYSRLLLPPREASPALHNAVAALCRGAGLTPTIVELAEPGVELALLAVSTGAGIALMPRCVRERHSSPGVRLVDVATDEPAFEFALVTHPQDDGLPTRALVQAFSSTVQPSQPALSLVA